MIRARLLILLAFATLAPAGAARADRPAPTAPAPLQFVAASKHKHKWVKVPKKVWVPPKYKKVRTGTDKKGRPIYTKKLVKAGHYKTVSTVKCNICGKKG